MQKHGCLLKILETAMGSLPAMATAQTLGPRYSSSAGVATLLNIQGVKREILRVMVGRLLALLATMVLGPVPFVLTGYRPLAMGISLLMLAPLCMKWGIQGGISVSTVLMIHILAEGFTGVADIANEALLLFMETGMGVLLNLHTPGSGTATCSAQGKIGEKFTCLLNQMASEFGEPGENGAWTGGHGFQTLEQALEQGERRAYEGMENNLLADTRYYLDYTRLRKSQFVTLCGMWDCFSQMESKSDRVSVVVSLLESVSDSFHERNNALGLLDELEQVELQMEA